MALDSLYALVSDDLQTLDQEIRNELSANVPFIDELSQYIINSGGKRLRPLTVILGAKACQYAGSAHISLAASMEFFHNATLLHDDVVDESELRRGRQTANHIWGDKPTILVGDFLFTRAFQVMMKSDNTRIMRLLADTANTITKGEVLQLLNCHNPDVDEATYRKVIYSKTSVLFAAAAQIGAILTQSDEQTIAKLSAYGTHLGNAFQIVDDALDFCADEEVLGKSLGDDLAEGKPTLPLIIALKKGNAEQQQLIQQAIKEGNIGCLQSIRQAIEDTSALAYCREVAEQEVATAIAQLDVIADSEYKTAMIELARFSVQRDF